VQVLRGLTKNVEPAQLQLMAGARPRSRRLCPSSQSDRGVVELLSAPPAR
jgi:hypothetical protein